MAISTFFGLQTTLSGILAQQRALDTTAHNVANANTIQAIRSRENASNANQIQAIVAPRVIRFGIKFNW